MSGPVWTLNTTRVTGFVQLTDKDGPNVWINGARVVRFRTDGQGGTLIVLAGTDSDSNVAETPDEVATALAGA